MPRKKQEPDRTMIGYARVSTREQNLDMQTAALLKAGVHPDALHIEKVSSGVANRPRLWSALEELRPGDTLVVYKMDRLARSVSELIQIMVKIKDAGANFVSLTEKIDTGSAIGKLYFHMSAAFAEFERDLIRERTSAGVRAAVERGQKFGRDPELTVADVKKARDLKRTGLSYRAVGAKMGWSHATIRKYLAGAGRPKKR